MPSPRPLLAQAGKSLWATGGGRENNPREHGVTALYRDDEREPAKYDDDTAVGSFTSRVAFVTRRRTWLSQEICSLLMRTRRERESPVTSFHYWYNSLGRWLGRRVAGSPLGVSDHFWSAAPSKQRPNGPTSVPAEASGGGYAFGIIPRQSTNDIGAEGDVDIGVERVWKHLLSSSFLASVYCAKRYLSAVFRTWIECSPRENDPFSAHRPAFIVIDEREGGMKSSRGDACEDGDEGEMMPSEARGRSKGGRRRAGQAKPGEARPNGEIGVDALPC